MLMPFGHDSWPGCLAMASEMLDAGPKLTVRRGASSLQDCRASDASNTYCRNWLSVLAMYCPQNSTVAYVSSPLKTRYVSRFFASSLRRVRLCPEDELEPRSN